MYLFYFIYRGVTFDDPSQGSEQLTFEDRYANLLPSIDSIHPFLVSSPIYQVFKLYIYIYFLIVGI